MLFGLLDVGDFRGTRECRISFILFEFSGTGSGGAAEVVVAVEVVGLGVRSANKSR